LGWRNKEDAMTQSMIGFVVGLAVLVVIAVVLGRRYRQEHLEDANGKTARMRQWLDSHHMHWPNHRH
jgi:hypothetical protein